MKKALSLFCALSTSAIAAYSPPQCGTKAPAPCNPDQCNCVFCLGPINYLGNAPVCPKTCNGDIVLKVAGFYWNAHQDGMAYALSTQVQNPFASQPGGPSFTELQVLNEIERGEYFTPLFKWDFGFKVGVGYCTTCDGWDLGLTWTWYRGKATDHIEAEVCDNNTLLPLWSAFAPANGSVLLATEIDSDWRLRLNLFDISLGRQFWTSKFLSLRPHVGIRIAYINQDFDLEHKGGSWSQWMRPGTQDQPAFNNTVSLCNDFHGVGLRSGLDSEWNLGCGWAFYAQGSTSIVYGRFSLSHEEENKLATTPTAKTEILDTHSSFRASRAMLDYSLGIQWASMFCNCQYGFKGRIGWEHNLFFDQNQLMRVVRIGDTAIGFTNGFNNSGENVITQSRGDLDTQGWTLTLAFEF